jgi:hypothetical protein
MSSLRFAGQAALAAVVTLVLSTIALLIFFGGGPYVFGPINDVLIALTLLLLLPAVWAVQRLAREGGRVGAWFTVLSVIAMIGMVEAAAGQLLLVIRVIDLQTSFMTGGIGILPFLVWMGALSVITLRRGVLAASVGWWGIAFLGVTVASLGAAPVLPMQTLVFVLGIPWLIGFGGWIAAVGLDLLRREPQVAREAVAQG